MLSSLSPSASSTPSSSAPSAGSGSQSSWNSSSWSLGGLGVGLQRKASGWLANTSPATTTLSSGRSTASSSSTSGGAPDSDVASIASSSLSLSSSCDSAILLDLADAQSEIEPLDADSSNRHSLPRHHYFKGSPLVADPISSDDEVVPLAPNPPSSLLEKTPTPTSTGSWRSFAKSALSSARVRLGSVSSSAPVSAAAAEPSAVALAGNPLPATPVAAPSPPPTPRSTTSVREDVVPTPAPTEYRLPWLGIGLPSAARRALRSTILSLSRSRSTFTEPLNPDFAYSSSLYSPLVTLLLAEDPHLATMRAKLVPRTLSDREFWHNYLYRVSLAVTHAKLDAGVGGALLPLIRSCSGPMLVTTSSSVTMGRPRANTAKSDHEQSAPGDPNCEPSAGRSGLVGLAAEADVDPMFVPLPEDGEVLHEANESASPLVIHDNIPETLTLDSDQSTILLADSSNLLSLSDLSHLDDDDTYMDNLSTDTDGSVTPDDLDMDRMLEYDTDAFYVLLQDMALSAPLPVVHVPDTLPESGTSRRKQVEVGEDGMMVVSLE